MRDLYLFEKRLSNSFDPLHERSMKENNRNICKFERDDGLGYTYTIMLMNGREWYTKRCIKLRRKLPE